MLPVLRALTFVPLVIAARLRREERRMIDWFRARGAFDAERAVTVTPSGPVARWVHQRLTSGGALRSAGERYYLDDVGYAAFRRRRRTRAIVILTLVLVAAAIVFFSQGDQSL